MIISARTGYRYNNLELPSGDLAAHAICNILQVNNDEVFNALVDTCSLESKLLFDDREVAERRVLTGSSGSFRMARFVSEVYLPSGDKFVVRSGNLAYIANKRQLYGYIVSQNVDRGIVQIKNKLDCLEKEVDELRRDESLLSHDKNELGNDIKQQSDRVNFLSRRLNQQRMELRCLNDEIDDILQDDTLDTSVLESECKSTEDELEDFQRREQDLNKAITPDRKLQDSLDALKKLDSVEKMIAVEMSECQSDVDAVYKRLREAKVEEITEQRELEAARSTVENLEQQLISVRDECDGQTQIALKLGRRPDEVNVPAQCNRRIKTVERQLARVRDKLEGRNGGAKGEVQGQESHYFDKIRGNLQRIRSMLNERVDNWTRFRKAISQHTSREFEKFMLLSNFADDRYEGAVRWRAFVHTGVVTAGSGQPNGVSVPNRGRVRRLHDSQNRSMTVELLVEAAKKNYNKQFIFVTPNDLSMLRPDPVVKIQKLAPPRYRAASAGAHDVDMDGVA
ncbi:hypothetical protein F443_13618 [Phytophthora nicotianae P1569]|uniref:RecF/RecN/SMC N-terminal domain-containing protein n=1 Tax=Phytophthora nicotianae P1569 TaxID=1317065 RepID=V9EPD4_PHYNI|nr:hypothetical protein F443_13618 [Phytophthora nicotianae P1569]